MKIPTHIAIIMDGNGRWAQRRGHARIFGHVRGSGRIKALVREADRLGVKALTLYAFSTENWTRPDPELRVLWKLMKRYLIREEAELLRKNVRLRVIGEVERLAPDLREVVETVVRRLSGNTGLELTFAISYGSRRELARAARLFAEDCVAGRARPGDLTDDGLRKYLWTADMGELADVDLMIRTSGESRISNFLLWQAAYAELLFVERCWPDFTIEDLRAAIEEYSRRDRRFGGVAEGSSHGRGQGQGYGDDEGAFA